MADLVGTLLDHFKIVELLGLGGMGAVYKARDVRLQRDVALKVMHPHIAEQADFKARFLQEARSAAKLDHTGIVKVHYFGQVDQRLYIVMQFIPGANLREMLEVLKGAGKWLPLDEAVQLVRQVSLALDYAHHRGVLHRDIKPKNIMIDPEPADGLPYHPVITDLGLARLADSDLVTRAGSSMGTPAYMSPEQALGRTTDARSDVYSLGVLLCELSVGRVPFPAKTITEAIRYHTREAPPAPRSIRPDLPESLERAILQALEKRPERRFSEAAALAQALVGVTAAVTEVAAKPSALADVVSLITQYEQSLVKPRGASILKEFDTPTDAAEDAIQVMVDGRTVATVAIVGTVTSIGRLDGNDIVLADSRASRHHAQVTFDGVDYRVVDLDSSNGTFLANVRLLPGVPEVWTPDRAMRIGGTWLHLARADQPAAAPLSGTRVAAAGPAGPAYSQNAGAGSGVGRVGLLVENPALYVTPGESVPVGLVVLNQGPLVDHFEVSVEGVPADWVSASVPLIRLLPGQRRAASLVIRPPRSPQARAGQHPLTIRVTSQSEPDQSALAEATLTVAAYYQYEVGMRPARQRGVAAGRYTLEVDNHSNADLTVRLDAVDPEDGCRYTFAPPYLAVAAGQAQKGELTVLPKAPLRGETDITYPFMVTARPDEAPELLRQAQGTWVHAPPAYEVSLRPEAPRGTTQGTFVIQVVNVGQAALSLALEALDAEEACRFNLSPPQISLPPGQEDMVQLTILPRAPLPTSEPRAHRFTVTVRPTEISGFTQQLQGEWKQIAPPQPAPVAPPPARRSDASPKPSSSSQPDATTSEPRWFWGCATLILGLVLTWVVALIVGNIASAQMRLGDKETWVAVILSVGTCLVLVVRGAIRVWRPDGSAAQPRAPTSPAMPSPTKPQPRRLRGAVVLVVGLAATAAAGLGAGNIAFEVLDVDDAGAWVVAGVVWLVGLILSIRVSRKAAQPS